MQAKLIFLQVEEVLYSVTQMNVMGNWLVLCKRDGISPFIAHLLGVDSIQAYLPINALLMSFLKGLLYPATYNMFFERH